MPMNGSGTASRVPGTTAIPNSTIKSAEYNASTDDIYAIFNTPRPIVYGGTNGASAVAGIDNLSTKGADIPSATTTNIGAATGRFVHITGTTTITGLGTTTAGVARVVVFDGILILTHNATSLILPDAVNITTAAGDVAIFVSEGAGNWRCINYQRAVTAASTLYGGYIFGLTLSNNVTDAVNDIDVAAGAASMSSSPYTVITLGGSITKRLDSGWAVGTNQGGLDTGSIANGTYHVYLIRRSDTGVVDVCFSASASAPTTGGSIPAAYDQYRRIGSFIRESAAIVTFVQDGDDFFYKSPTTEVTAVNPGTAAVTRTLRVPIGVRVTVLSNVVVRNSTAAGQWIAYISDLSLDDVAPGLTGPLSNAGTGGIDNRQGQQVLVKTNTSGQVRSRLFASDANTTLFIATTGWIDRRGKN